jgi:hypothetical protein
MSDEGDRDVPRRAKPSLIDVTVPNAARAADFLQGGRDHFAADRKAIRAVAASAPAIERIPAEARAFRLRVIRYLVTEAGIRQFLDIGTGLVPPGVTHEVAQALDPQCRIVYTDSDPMVLSHAQALIGSVKGGPVNCVGGDIADVDAIVASALPTLDLSEPVGVLDRRRQGRVIADGRRPVRQLRRDLPPRERPGPGDAGRGAALEQDRAEAARAPLRRGRPLARVRP